MKIPRIIRSGFLFLGALFSMYSAGAQGTYTTLSDNGIEQIDQYLPLLKGRKIGITVNHSSTIQGKRSLDFLMNKGVDIVRLFGPEHGLAGAVAANTHIRNDQDAMTGLPIVSLFGEKFKPSEEDLQGIDLMLFDMQDVGVRFYTYISTLHYIMEACAEQGIPVIVLDRPNPNGHYIDGPILDTAYQSFIGMHPIPISHGMTIGEYAQMINGEGWLADGIQCELQVIPVKNYDHGKRFGYKFAPSPNLNAELSIYTYPSLCWFGATAISDGRGTFAPYLQIGHPSFKGLYKHAFIPNPIPGMNEDPKLKGEICYGLDLRTVPIEMFLQGGKLRLDWLLKAYHDFHDKTLFFNGEKDRKDKLHFDLLAGSGLLRKQIHEGLEEHEIRSSWEAGLSKFKKTRSKYLLYRDVSDTFKIMSYNIHHGYDAAEENRLEEMTRIVETISPDFLALQEVDSVCERSSFTDQARFIAERNGMQAIFFKHFKLGEGSYGNAILSKYPMENVQEYRLPVQGKEDGVTFITADVFVGGKTIRLANVHMDYRSEASRVRQAHLIVDILKQSPHPVVLMGDFNARPMTEELRVLSKEMVMTNDLRYATFPADKPDRLIDYILVSPTLAKNVLSYTYPSIDSDHLPVVTVLSW